VVALGEYVLDAGRNGGSLWRSNAYTNADADTYSYAYTNADADADTYTDASRGVTE